MSDDTTAAEPLSLTITDTDPVSINPTTAHVIDLATSPAVVEDINFVTGADGVGGVTFTTPYTGEPAMDADGNELSFNGSPLYLYTTDGGTVIVASTSDTLEGITTENTGYTVTLNGDGTYEFNSNGVIANGSAVSATDLSGVGGGNVVWKGLYGEIDSPDPQGDFALPGTSQDVMLSTSTGNTVNTNANDIGISSGNSFSFGEGIRLDFVNGLEVTKSGSTYSFTYDGTHNLTNAFRQDISFAQSTVNITLAAIVADADDFFYNDDGVGETKVALDIDNINVYDASGNLMEAGVDYTYTDHGDTITLNGLQQGWDFEIVTEGENEQFSAVQIDAATGTDEFKLGKFSYGQESDGNPIELNYDIEGTDGDGDAVTGTVDVVLYPDGSTVEGTDSGETLNGTDQTDYILAYDGDDSLFGFEGEDTLIGGQGNDTMDGGADADTFIFSLAENSGNDTINNFEAGTDVLAFEDVIDVNATAGIDLGDAIESYDNGGNGSDLVLHLTNGGQITLTDAGSDTLATGSGLTTDANLEAYLAPSIQSDQS